MIEAARISSAITEALELFRLGVLSNDSDLEQEAAEKIASVVGWEIAQAQSVSCGAAASLN